jgi:two-component system OmpR family sensor kinase
MPMLFGIVLVLLLAEFQVIEFHFSIQDVDTIILFSGLIATTLLCFALISREGIRRIEQRSTSELKATYAEERMRFLRRLDHEIKNPLMGIQMALDNLSQEDDLQKRQKIRSAIGEQIVRLTRLVADLRRIGDMEKHEIEYLPVDPNMLLRDAFQMLSDESAMTERKIEIDVPANLPPIIGDYDLLLLAIHNLLTNALKYTRKGDKIRLAAHVDDACLRVAVLDTGPGIAPEDLPYVMDELYRSQHVKDIPGSGVGLSLVKRILERHHGKITLHSRVNEGTVVVLCLPLPD